eukprot:Gb_34334 [translate_table: standard]
MLHQMLAFVHHPCSSWKTSFGLVAVSDGPEGTQGLSQRDAEYTALMREEQCTMASETGSSHAESNSDREEEPQSNVNTQRRTGGKFWTREDLDKLERKFGALESSVSQVLGMAPDVQQQILALETEIAKLRRLVQKAPTKTERAKSSSSSVNQPSKSEGKKGIKCFICKGPHYARHCPQCTDLNTFRQEGESRDEEPTLTTGAMQIIGAVQVIDCLSEEKTTKVSLSIAMEGGLDETNRVAAVHCEPDLETWHDETGNAKSDERPAWLEEIFRRHELIAAKGEALEAVKKDGPTRPLILSSMGEVTLPHQPTEARPLTNRQRVKGLAAHQQAVGQGNEQRTVSNNRANNVQSNKQAKWPDQQAGSRTKQARSEQDLALGYQGNKHLHDCNKFLSARLSIVKSANATTWVESEWIPHTWSKTWFNPSPVTKETMLAIAVILARVWRFKFKMFKTVHQGNFLGRQSSPENVSGSPWHLSAILGRRISDDPES